MGKLALALLVVAGTACTPAADPASTETSTTVALLNSTAAIRPVDVLAGYRIVAEEDAPTTFTSGLEFAFQTFALWRATGASQTVEIRRFGTHPAVPALSPDGDPWEQVVTDQGDIWIGRPRPWIGVWQGEGEIITFTQTVGSSRSRLLEFMEAYVVLPNGRSG